MGGPTYDTGSTVSSTRTKPELDLEAILAESERAQRDRPLLTWLHLFLPLGILGASIAVLHFVGVLDRVAKAAVVAFFTIGKLIIVSGAATDIWKMTALELAFVVFFMDVWVAYLLAFNLHFVYRVPRMGPWLRRLQNYCRYWLAKQPWMKKWAFTGVMLFVMFPLTGTGAPGGSILGRLGGLRAWVTLFGIGLGSALGCVLMTAFAAPLEPVFREVQREWWFKASGLGVLVILLLILFHLGRRVSKAAEEYAKLGGEA